MDILFDQGSLQLTQYEFFTRLLVALGIGVTIGLEREFSAMRDQVQGFAGVRTFVMVTLFGLLGGMAIHLIAPWVYAVMISGVVLLTGISYFITAGKGDVGATTEFSVLIAFILGTLTLLGHIQISLVITVIVVVLLSSKLRIQSVVGKITAEELYDIIRYVVVALLLFPFLPDERYGPYGVLNPREIGWVVILTSGIGLVGYMIMKFIGTHRGMLLSGLVGGLISSTAVTWIFARRSREHHALSTSCSVAILGASSVMVVRVIIWTFVFNQALFSTLIRPMTVVFLVAAGLTLFYYMKQRKRETAEAEIRKGKPLDFQGALVFGAIFVVVLLAVSYANERLGEEGLFISSAIAGLSDIDAIAITLSKLAGLNIDLDQAARAILLATLSNTLIKLGIALWAGSPLLRRELIAGYGILAAVLLGTFFIL
jgi:uncharacterized membrane protein (DUF4010 family)